MLRFDEAYVLLTDLIIMSSFKAAVTFNFCSSILLMLEVGLRFGFIAKSRNIFHFETRFGSDVKP